jgi:hypothetical protein
MYKSLITTLMLSAGLVGCSLGVAPGRNSPSLTFQAPVSYQAALASAQRQAELCLRGKKTYDVVTEQDAAIKTATLRVTAPYTSNDLARVEIAGQGDKRSDVRVVMWGESIWNGDAVRAMRDAVLYDLPSCTSFMPVDAAPPKK